MKDTLHVVGEIFIKSKVAEEVIDNEEKTLTRMVMRLESL